MAKRPRVALLSVAGSTDRHAWSGTVSRMADAAEQHIGPVSSIGPLALWPKQAGRVASVLAQTTGRGRVLSSHTRLAARVWGRAATRRCRALGPDVVLAPAASVALAHFHTDAPVVYVSDATARQLLGYYPGYSGVTPRSFRAADDLEAAALDRSDLILYPTRWAADSAVADYGVPPEKVFVAPYGANLPDAVTEPEPEHHEPTDGSLRLLVIGVDWHTKGIDHAVDATGLLRDAGVDARLTVIGCAAPGPVPDFVEVVGFLDKSTPEDLLVLRRAFEQAHLLLLPSRAEAFGIVQAEAAAFGVPVVVRATGGSPEVLPGDELSRTFAEDGAGSELAAAILELWNDPDELRRMQARVRQQFTTTLNWSAWGRSVRDRVAQLL